MSASTRDIRLLVRTELERALKDMDKFNKELSKIERQARAMSVDMKDLTRITKGFISALAIKEVSQFSLEAAKLHGQAVNLRRSMGNLANQEGIELNSIMKQLRESTAGTVSEIELMKNATLAKFLGIDLKNLPTLFEFARQRAKETGEDVNFLVQSIVRGIGRRSILILDNLGISMGQLRNEVKEILVEQGKWNGKLSESVVQLHFQEAATRVASKGIEQSGELLDTAADKADRLIAKLENMKLIFGAVFGPGTIKLLDTFVGGLEHILELFGANIDIALTEGLEKTFHLAQRDLAELNKELKTLDSNIGALDDQISRKQSGDDSWWEWLTSESTLEANKALLEKRRRIVQEDIDFYEKDLVRLQELIDKDRPDPSPGSGTGGDGEKELADQKRIAEMIRKLRVEQAVLSAKTEFDARLAELRGQYERELQLAGDNADARALVEANHQLRVQKLREETRKKHREQVEKEVEAELKAIQRRFDQEAEYWEERRQAAADVAQAIGSVFESAFLSLTDDLLDAASEGGEAWRVFFRDLRNELARFLASQLLKSFLNFLASSISPVGPLGNIFGSIFGAQSGAHIKGSKDGQIIRVGENNTEEVIIPVKKFGDFVSGNYQLPGGYSISDMPAPALSSPSGGSTTTIERIVDRTTPVSGEIVVRTIAHELATVEGYQIAVNRQINRQDNRYVDEFLTTKKGEFED